MYNTATQRHTEIPARRDTDYANAVSDIVYGYNNMGELASVTVLKENGQTPTAVASSTIYDALGGTSTTTLPNTVYTYDAGGRLETTLDSATGITTKYTYKPNTNYVQTETVTNAAGTTLASYTYTYRADGLRIGETDATYNSDGTVNDTRTLAWTYDGLDRLAQETSTDTAGVAALNYIDAYGYDLDSNRTTETVESTTGTVTDTITSTYNADDELTQAVDANTGTTVYGYDSNGSQTSVTHTPNGTTTPDSTTANEYDLQGQLAGSQVTTSAGTATTTYFYDDSGNPDNNLSSLEIGTGLLEETTTPAGSTTPVVTYYLVDTNNPTGYSQPIEQAATPGTPQITYVWGAQLISETYATGATIPGVGTASSPTIYYLVQDAHGSTRLVTDANGNIVARYNYDAFGNALGFDAPTALTTYLYSSMPYDAASGNYYDHARFYNSGTGEFTQSDYGYSGSLANPMADLPYMYGGGDPINMLDLSGHDFSLGSLTVGIGIASLLNGAIGGVVGGVQSGALGALGGALNGFVATSVGFTTALLLDPMGPIGYGLGFGFGAIAGESLDLAIQGKALSSPEARIDVAVSGVLGFFGGVMGGEAAVSYAGEIGKRLMGYPAIRASMTEIANGQGVYTVGAVEFVQYYSEHPWQFANILTKFISEKSVGENLFETAKAIIGGLAVSRAQDTLVSALVQPVSEFMQAFQALDQNIENNSGGSQVSAGGS